MRNALFLFPLVLLGMLFPFTGRAASQVRIEWDPIPGAKQYELNVEGGLRWGFTRLLPIGDSYWVGPLASGEYTYRIRAYDSQHHVGVWSAFLPVTVPGARFHLGAGMSGGTNYFFPSASLEYGVAPRWAAGLTALYINRNEFYTEVRGEGVFFTASYFLENGTYSGLFGQLGVGAYLISEPTVHLSHAEPAVSVTLHWRREMLWGIDVGVAVGGQYVAKITETSPLWVVDFSGFFPLFQGELGFRF